MPSGTTFVPGSVTGASGTPPTLSLLAPVPAGGTSIVTFQVQIGSTLPSPNPIVNAATAAFQYTIDPAFPDAGSGSAASNNANTIVSTVVLTVDKTVDKFFADLGDIITYTLTVKNTGNVAADNVILTDAVPVGTSFVLGSVTGATGTPPMLTLLAPVAAGGTAVVTFQVKVGTTIPVPNPIPNTVSAVFQYTVDPSHPDAASGSAAGNTVETTVNNATLTATKQVSKAYADLGDILTYTIIIQNSGNVPADNVVITDVVPVGTTYVPGSVTGATGTPPTLTVIGSIPAGGSAVVTFQVQVDTTLPAFNPVMNAATINYQYTVDPAQQDGASGETQTNPVETQINNAAISIEKMADLTNASPGDVITYTLILQNTGNVPANNVVITDPLPNGTTFVAGSLSPNATGAPPAIAVTNPIPAGGSVVVTYQVKINNMIPDPNPIPNTADVAFTYTVDPAHPNTGSGTGESNTVTTYVAAPYLVITKTADKDIAYLGETFTYTLNIENIGTLPADNVKITDNIPTGLTYVPASIAADVLFSGDPTSVITLSSSILPGGTAKIWFQVTVTEIPPFKEAVNVASAQYTYTKDPLFPDGVTVTTLSNQVITCLHKFNFMQAATDVVESIALEQTALSHILNAEGEKIQRAVANPTITPEELLAINKSVEDMVNSISNLETILHNKATLVQDQVVC